MTEKIVLRENETLNDWERDFTISPTFIFMCEKDGLVGWRRRDVHNYSPEQMKWVLILCNYTDSFILRYTYQSPTFHKERGTVSSFFKSKKHYPQEHAAKFEHYEARKTERIKRGLFPIRYFCNDRGFYECQVLNFSIERESSEMQIYDIFFAFKLRQVYATNINDFLNYHRLRFHGDFKNYIYVIMQKFDCLFDPITKTIANKWIEDYNSHNLEQLKEIEREKHNDGEIFINRPLERRPKDKVTALTATQTAILFNYLAEMNIILDENYQTKIDLSKAIHAITGYSHKTIRSELSIKVHSIKPKDNAKIREVLQSILKKMGNDL